MLFFPGSRLGIFKAYGFSLSDCSDSSISLTGLLIYRYNELENFRLWRSILYGILHLATPDLLSGNELMVYRSILI